MAREVGPCESCAFREGAAAHNEVYNRLRAQICALTGVPFWCHHTTSGADITGSSSFKTKAEVSAVGLRICEGWKREVVQNVKPGPATFKRLVRRWKGEAILEMIEEFVRSEGEDKQEVLQRLDHAIRTLHAADGFTEEVSHV